MQGFKYPRRLRTGRPLTANKKETNPTDGDMWVPQDHDFDDTKLVRLQMEPLYDRFDSQSSY